MRCSDLTIQFYSLTGRCSIRTDRSPPPHRTASMFSTHQDWFLPARCAPRIFKSDAELKVRGKIMAQGPCWKWKTLTPKRSSHFSSAEVPL